MIRRLPDLLRLGAPRLMLALRNGVRSALPNFWAKQLRLLDLDFETIIDVGVAQGTPELYNVYPQADLFLVEPNPACRASIEEITRTHKGRVRWVQKGAGSSEGSVVLHVPLGHPEWASMHEREQRSTTAGDDGQLEVEVARLDDLIDEAVTGPFLLKIDTEGHDLEVLEGSRETLKRCAAVILECSVGDRFSGSYGFAEIVHFLHLNGFKLSDRLSEGRRRRELMYMDLVFIPA